jgi:hypothetical protein
MCGETKPSRITTPAYPAYRERTGHNGASFYEHISFIDDIEGKKTTAATAGEGFWSIVVGPDTQVSS